MWIIALEAEPGKRWNMLSSEVKARWLPAKSLSCRSHRQGLTWLLSCLLTFHSPAHMIEVKCLLFPLQLLFWYGPGSVASGGDDPERSETQTWARDRQEAGAHPTAPKLTPQPPSSPHPPPWLSRVAHGWQHLVSSANSVCKWIYKRKPGNLANCF